MRLFALILALLIFKSAMSVCLSDCGEGNSHACHSEENEIDVLDKTHVLDFTEKGTNSEEEKKHSENKSKCDCTCCIHTFFMNDAISLLFVADSVTATKFSYKKSYLFNYNNSQLQPPKFS